jgi:hypothetical protein
MMLPWHKSALVYVAGILTGIAATYVFTRTTRVAAVPPTVCYSCFWQGYDAKLQADLIDYYKQYKNADPLVLADSRYILWRATGIPNCDIRQEYQHTARDSDDPQRRYVAYATLAFGAAECGAKRDDDLKAAARAAGEAGFSSERKVLAAAESGGYKPHFDTDWQRPTLTAPTGAHSFILGTSKIEIGSDAVIAAQVDRVTRDWISYQLHWDLGKQPLSDVPINYHEGAMIKRIAAAAPAKIVPIVGSLVAKRGDQWYGSDETGTFRFPILPDKIMYPTTHVDGDLGIVEDTHGISLLVPGALEHKAQVAIGCGDSEGKMQAALYLANRGVNVIFPGDRYQDELLGYSTPGVLLGGAPVRAEGGKAVVGDQPIKFRVSEPIVAEDTIAPFPLQYYDAPARYFRGLAKAVPLHVTYVRVETADQISRILDEADHQKSTAVGVRIVTEYEYLRLKGWLMQSPTRRAVLFHSGLYPYAQKLFSEFRQQVTFGDLKPQFE